MAQSTSSASTAMGPPSPKEPRRSNRRSVTSTSASKSSGSPSPDASMPPPKDSDHSSSVSSATGAAVTTSSKRSKRKSKDRPGNVELQIEAQPSKPAVDDVQPETVEDDEEAGVTRCVCGGSADDDPEPEGFMIQCELCKVWQHGPCMGFPSEEQAPQGDYYCEKCRPDDHVELLKKLQKRHRQNSAQSHQASHTAASRSSRSHSPSHHSKPSKRRNTMNSRDAAYDENFPELLDAAMNEGALPEAGVKDLAPNLHAPESGEIILEIPGGRKKRKRVDDDALSAKRKRSASVVSERPPALAPSEILPEQAELNLPPPTPTTKTHTGRGKRGGNRKTAAAMELADNAEFEDGNGRRHPNQYTYRGKQFTGGPSRRAPPSFSGASASDRGATHEHGTRRNATNQHSSATGNNSNTPQPPLFTSWGLPDYLAHLQSMLPTDVPEPVQVRGASSFSREGFTVPTAAEGGEPEPMESRNVFESATLSSTERGVKVKWPAKRMSVVDMNKRVRSLVEWVGREQANASERDRRRDAIEKALALMKINSDEAARESCDSGPSGGIAEDGQDARTTQSDAGPSSMAVDAPLKEQSNPEAQPAPSPRTSTPKPPDPPPDAKALDHTIAAFSRLSTTKMMEGLMEELISFQERFGPGVKIQNKDRSSRQVVAVA